MNLTDTFKAQAESHTGTVIGLRAALAAVADTDEYYKDLYYKVVGIAQNEAAARLFLYAAAVAEHNPEELASWIQDESLRSADDTWSGRTNDLARSIRDTELSVLKQIARSVKFSLTNAKV